MKIIAGITGILDKYQPVGVDSSNNVDANGEDFLFDRNNTDAGRKKFLDHLLQTDLHHSC